MNMILNRERLVAAGILIVLAILAFSLYRRIRPDPQLAHARELGKQLADRSLSADQRRELGKQFREEMQKLSPQQRGDLFKDRQKAMRDRIAGFFKKSKQEQMAQLDEDINRMQQFRGQGPPPGGRNGAQVARSSDDRDNRKRERIDQTTPEERAQRAEYFKQLNARRQQRGLGSIGFGRSAAS
jgi:hypothetical protein